MKNFNMLTILLLSSVVFFCACNNNTKVQKQETLKPLEVIDAPAPPKAMTPNPAARQTSQNAGMVWHYTCSKGCAGGAGSAVNCVTCGGLLVHNQAYHANTNSTPTSSAPYATPPPVAQPGKNAAGIWHYACGNGCVGGSGAAGACGTCGSPLIHNTAYHQ